MIKPREISEFERDRMCILNNCASYYRSTGEPLTARKFYNLFIKRERLFTHFGIGYYATIFMNERFNSVEYVYELMVSLYELLNAPIDIGYYSGISTLVKPNAEDKSKENYIRIRLKKNSDGIISSNGIEYFAGKVIDNEEELFINCGIKNIYETESLDKVEFLFNFRGNHTEIKERKNTIPLLGKSKSISKPMVFMLENTTDEVKRVKLFRNQSIPEGVIPTYLLPGVKFDEFIEAIKAIGYNFGKIRVERNKDFTLDDVFHIGCTWGNLSGTSRVAPLSLSMYKNQYITHAIEADINLDLNLMTSIFFEIEPKSKLIFYLYEANENDSFEKEDTPVEKKQRLTLEHKI